MKIILVFVKLLILYMKQQDFCKKINSNVLVFYIENLFNIFRDNEQIKFYRDGVKQAIEYYGTPSCKQKLNPEKISVRYLRITTDFSFFYFNLMCTF